MIEKELGEEREQLLEIMLLSSSFFPAISAYSVSEEVAGFYPLWFPQGKFFVYIVSCDF